MANLTASGSDSSEPNGLASRSRRRRDAAVPAAETAALLVPIELTRRRLQHLLHARRVRALAVDADHRLGARLAEEDPGAVGEVELHAVLFLARGEAGAEATVERAGARSLEERGTAVHGAMEIAAVVVQRSELRLHLA